MRQRAKELGALPTGLVRPGEVFDWPVQQGWAEPVSDQEALADLDRQIAAARAEVPVESASGARVVAGKSETSPPPDRTRRARNRTAET